MGTKTTTTEQQQQNRSQTTTGAMTDQERQMQEMLMEMAGVTSGQFGDISNIAAGDIMDIPQSVEDKIREVYDSAARSSRGQAESDYKSQQHGLQNRFAARGYQDTSREFGDFSRLGTEHSRTLADIENQRSGGIAQTQLALPFQLAQTQLGANKQLSDMFAAISNPMMNNFMQTRLANRTTSGYGSSTGSEETSGFTVGELASLLSAAGQVKNG